MQFSVLSPTVKKMGKHFMLCALLLLLYAVVPKECASIKDLNGVWTVSDLIGQYQNLPASVPGGIYTDLKENNAIPDVFADYNDVETRWVAKRDWRYEREFTVEDDFLSHDQINLVLDGLDTFATVEINNKEVLVSENMFIQYIVNVTSELQVGQNTITVTFKSPINEATRLYEEQLKDYEVLPTCVSDGYNGECHVNHIRKMQASFSWDWGPALPSVGIWKPIYLEAYNSAAIRDISVYTTEIALTGSWNVALKVYLSAVAAQGTLKVDLATDVTNFTQLFDVDLAVDEDGEAVATVNFNISNVSRWWPNGYGRQNLYPLNVTFASPDGETSLKSIKIGFRTIKLKQEEMAGGRSFYFAVNNIPMFAKGSNSIPINILPERGQNETVIRFLLGSAKETHMNMLRVWGGGVYESDAFYDIADELGILVWQDFMFACAMYPTKVNYLDSVRKEVRHQVRRLQHHASVAVWAANNENEAALRSNWYGTDRNFSLYAEDYVKLYIGVVRDETLKYDDSRDFLTSSPTNGIKSEEEGFIAENPYSLYYGDEHFYNYLLSSWEKNFFPVTRFTSEYGYQSMPEVETWLSATNNKSNLHPDSEFLGHRQHLGAGNAYLKLQIGFQFNLPDICAPNYVDAFIFYSQISQAVAYKHQTEYYRQWKSVVNSDSTGLTMGALYWQLNDVWVAPTWSGIDFQNRWKMLQYYVKEFFAPIIVTGHLTAARQLDVYVVSDVLSTYYNVSLKIQVYKWSSLTPVFVQTVITDVLANISKKIFSIWLDSYLSSLPECKSSDTKNTECFLYLSLVDSNNNSLAPNNFVFPTELKAASLVAPNLKVSSILPTAEDGREFAIGITTDVVALFVWLESNGVPGRFSENGFLQVQPNKTVYFYSDNPTNIVSLTNSLRVVNLLDASFL